MMLALWTLLAFFGGTFSTLLSTSSYPKYSRPLSGISPDDVLQPLNTLSGTPISGQAFLTAPKRKWPNGVVHWQYDPANTFTGDEKSLLEKAMAKISEVACVYFVPRVAEPAYLEFQSSDDVCAYYQGFINDFQRIIMAPNCFGENTANAIHLILHSLGMEHEHLRFDRDLYMEVLWDNIDPQNHTKFEKLPRTLANPMIDLDFSSLMMYTPHAYGLHGRPTMWIKEDTTDVAYNDIGRAIAMSKSDEWHLKSAYPCINGEDSPDPPGLKASFSLL